MSDLYDYEGFWKLENVLKHKSCLDLQIKYYGSINFILN